MAAIYNMATVINMAMITIRAPTVKLPAVKLPPDCRLANK
jgi:hypothetical protein